MKIIKKYSKIFIIKEAQLIVSLITNYKIGIKKDTFLLKEDLKMIPQQF